MDHLTPTTYNLRVSIAQLLQPYCTDKQGLSLVFHQLWRISSLDKVEEDKLAHDTIY